MPELSIAMSLAELALREAQQAKALKVNEIEIDVGDWSGVDYEALQFSLNAVLQSEEMLRQSKLIINRCKPKMHCKTCHHDFTPKVMYCTRCDSCGAETVELREGRELSLKSLVIED